MTTALQLQLVGIGTGNPEHLSLAAVRVLNEADLILLPDKGDSKAELLQLRRDLCAKLLSGAPRLAEFALPQRAGSGDYRQAVDAWHDAIARCWQQAIETHLPPNGRKVALLIWGDPAFYDSSLRIAQRLLRAFAADLQLSVIPGISSIQALCAAHCIPLNAIGEAVQLTTGRLLRQHGWPRDADTVVVMLDGGTAFETLAPATEIDIWWGAYLGMAQQCLRAGRLAEVGAEIVATRARLRAEHGWIMDIYVLRRQRPLPALGSAEIGRAAAERGEVGRAAS